MKKSKRMNTVLPPGVLIWEENGEIHTLMPGLPPSAAEIEDYTRQYRAAIKKSPLWQQMIAYYGKEKAEELLQECRFEVRP